MRTCVEDAEFCGRLWLEIFDGGGFHWRLNPAVWGATAATGGRHSGWVGLNLNPHPRKAEGAAPKFRGDVLRTRRTFI
jgi:hypothetical protein